MANVKGSALSSRVLWLQLAYGEAGIQRLLPQCTPGLRAELEAGVAKARWYPLAQFIELITVIDRLFGEGDLALGDALARHGVDADLTTIYRLLFKAGTTHWILGRAARLWGAHHDSGHLQVLTRGPNTAVLRIRGFDDPHPIHCRSVLGWGHRSIELSGGAAVKSAESQCATRGAPYCQIDASWQ